MSRYAGKYFVFDFDSTFTKVEALDELCEISKKDAGDKADCLRQIQRLTDAAMSGKLSFRESLAKRLKLLAANQSHLAALVEVLKGKVSDSIVRNKAFFREQADRILIVSGGFKSFIVPVVADYGLSAEKVYANDFVCDAQGNICGFDTKNPLSESGGKVKLMQTLKLKGDVFVVGDGYTDYEIRAAGLAKAFCAFTENIRREKVVSKADCQAASFEEMHDCFF